MILDILFLISAIIIVFPFVVFLCDWYHDYIHGMNRVEVKYKDGREEKFMYNSKERRMFLRTMKKYKVDAKVE